MWERFYRVATKGTKRGFTKSTKKNTKGTKDFMDGQRTI
jgi:hypothetical protein